MSSSRKTLIEKYEIPPPPPEDEYTPSPPPEDDETPPPPPEDDDVPTSPSEDENTPLGRKSIEITPSQEPTFDEPELCDMEISDVLEKELEYLLLYQYEGAKFSAGKEKAFADAIQKYKDRKNSKNMNNLTSYNKKLRQDIEQIQTRLKQVQKGVIGSLFKN